MECISISVIITIFNSEKYIKRCLDYIIAQTFKNIEIILINDGSNDNSKNICYKYCRRYGFIKLVNQEKRGVAQARNKGVEIAKGKYITFVDSDDYIDVNMFEEMYKAIEKLNADLCICNYIKEDKNTKKYCDSGIKKDILTNKEVKKLLQIRLIERDNSEKKHELAVFRGACGKLYRNKIIENNNIRFKKELVIGEDFLFNLEYLNYTNSVVLCKKYYYHYVTNIESLTQKYEDKCWYRYKSILINIKKFSRDNDFYNQEEYRFVKLVLKYFLISIRNEHNYNNNKSLRDEFKYIRQICTEDMVESSLKKYRYRDFSIWDNILLIITRYSILGLLLYIIIRKYLNRTINICKSLICQ